MFIKDNDKSINLIADQLIEYTFYRIAIILIVRKQKARQHNTI